MIEKDIENLIARYPDDFFPDEGFRLIRQQYPILKRMTNCPILKRNLIHIPGLEKLSIFRQFQGTNFPVRNSEWQIISRLISK